MGVAKGMTQSMLIEVYFIIDVIDDVDESLQPYSSLYHYILLTI